MLLGLIVIIRPQRAELLCQRLIASGLVQDLTASECRGYGRQKGHLETYAGSDYQIDFLPKVQVNGVIDQDDRERVVDLILSTARTGRIGDGKILFVPVAGEVEW